MLWSRTLLACSRFWERMKCWKLQRVPHEEDRRVVADHVEVALRGVEPQREAPRGSRPGVWAASFAGDRREPDQRVGLGARLEDRRPLVYLLTSLVTSKWPKAPPPPWRAGWRSGMRSRLNWAICSIK